MCGPGLRLYLEADTKHSLSFFLRCNSRDINAGRDFSSVYGFWPGVPSLASQIPASGAAACLSSSPKP